MELSETSSRSNSCSSSVVTLLKTFRRSRIGYRRRHGAPPISPTAKAFRDTPTPSRTELRILRSVPGALSRLKKSGATGGCFEPPVSSQLIKKGQEHWRAKTHASGTQPDN